jgi:hypothetical protein
MMTTMTTNGRNNENDFALLSWLKSIEEDGIFANHVWILVSWWWHSQDYGKRGRNIYGKKQEREREKAHQWVSCEK